MDRLILLRHGKAESESESGDDFDRRLSPRGVRESAAMAETLAELGFAPDVALVSPALGVGCGPGRSPLRRLRRRPAGRLHPFLHSRTGAGNRAAPLRRPGGPDRPGGRGRGAGPRPALGALARRRALPAPLRPPGY